MTRKTTCLCISNSLLLGDGTLDGGSGSALKLLKACESKLSGFLGDIGQALDNFSDSVDASLEDNFGGEEGALRVLLALLDAVVALVLNEEGNSSLGASALGGSLLGASALDLGGGEADSLIVGKTSGGGVVEVGQVQGVVRPLLSV